MIYGVIGFVAGLIVGWNFLPQPMFVKNTITKVKSWIGSIKAEDLK